MNKQIIWVLVDDRPGNYSQSIGLAEGLAAVLNCQIEIKKVAYNSFAKLPNFLKICGLIGVDAESKKSLLDSRFRGNDKSPNIIISTGRKTAPIAASLKKNYNALAIQIMNPNLNFKKFDLVILPTHDGIKEGQNVINIIGALGRIKPELLQSEYQKFADVLEKISSPKIALLVGGSSKKGNFNAEIAENLAEVVSNLTTKMNAHLLILNSRRTGAEITEILDKKLNCPKTFFKWQSQNWQNPYFAVLQTADFIIATGDSISMCSEICSIGKPIYIFNPQEICSKKHLKFHEDLFAKNYAKQLISSTQILENYHTNKLDETARISKLISDRFKL